MGNSTLAFICHTGLADISVDSGRVDSSDTRISSKVRRPKTPGTLSDRMSQPAAHLDPAKKVVKIRSPKAGRSHR